MRKYVKTTHTQMIMSTEEEHSELLRLIRGRQPDPRNYERFGERLAAGTIVQVTESWGNIAADQLAVVITDSYPTVDGDYLVWHIDSNGELARGNVRTGKFKIWTPSELPKQKVPAKARRRLKLNEPD